MRADLLILNKKLMDIRDKLMLVEMEIRKIKKQIEYELDIIRVEISK